MVLLLSLHYHGFISAHVLGFVRLFLVENWLNCRLCLVVGFRLSVLRWRLAGFQIGFGFAVHCH
ncbi:unnamed protein product [Linum tenue]|uniref:Uncharacterized protein n=1 Tax=Linum tenue TaxID=586396 RepID=A0AAV0KTF1_9ROSI|nr:unnamed protein product [Linum tenue]